MDSSSNYIGVGALAAAAGSYAYTYNQVNNIQKEITKITESINKTNESMKVYDDNVKEGLNKIQTWATIVTKDVESLSVRLASIEEFLMNQLGYEPHIEEPIHHRR